MHHAVTLFRGPDGAIRVEVLPVRADDRVWPQTFHDAPTARRWAGAAEIHRLPE